MSGNGTFNFVLTGRGATLTSREGGRRPQLIVETESSPETLVAAGDIADGTTGDEQTAALVDTIPGTVAALGDLAYENGSASDFATYYEPTWGRFKARTRPAAGKPRVPDAQRGRLLRLLGRCRRPADSRVVQLRARRLARDRAQLELPLRRGLPGRARRRRPGSEPISRRIRRRCTLAYWHHPRFSTGVVGDSPDIRPLFQALYDGNADLLLVGHAHNYQRWSPLNPTGAADAARGIRQFVVGTGGRAFHEVSPPDPRQEIANDDTLGVLRLLLGSRAFTWQFQPVAGRTFTDSGSQTCH